MSYSKIKLTYVTDIGEEEGGDEEESYRYRLHYEKQIILENQINGSKHTISSPESEIQRARLLNDTIRYTPDYLSLINMEQLVAIQRLAGCIKTHKKVTFALYGGVCVGTGYGIFAGNTILYYIMLCYTTLCYVILHYIMLHHIMLYNIILYYVTSIHYCIVLYYIMFCHIISIPYCTLYYVILYHILLYHVT